MFISKSPSAQDADSFNSSDNKREDRVLWLFPSKHLILISNVANVVLLLLKTVMLCVSVKKSMIASFVDSLLDCLFGFGLSFCVAHTAKNLNRFPLGIFPLKNSVILILSAACVLLTALNIDDDIRDLLSSSERHFHHIERIFSVVGFLVIILSKSVLYLACRRNVDPYVNVLGKDHLTDVAANFLPLVVYISGNKSPRWLDGTAGLILNLYIASVWLHQMYDSFFLLRLKESRSETSLDGLNVSVLPVSSKAAIFVVKFKEVAVDILEVIKVISSHSEFITYDSFQILFSFSPSLNARSGDESTAISGRDSRSRDLETIMEEDDSYDEKWTSGAGHIV